MSNCDHLKQAQIFRLSGVLLRICIKTGDLWNWCFVDEVAFDLSHGVAHAQLFA